MSAEHVHEAFSKARPFKPKAKTNGAAHDGQPVRKLSYFTGEQVDTADRVFDDELVEGVIGKNCMAVLYGDSNSGKTFLAIDLAACIEQGITWMGRHTVPGLVVYLATEAPESVRMRLSAYKRRHRVPLRHFVVVSSPINLFDTEADVDAVAALVAQLEEEHGQKAVLVIGDTLARLAAGANENSGEDMTVVLRNADAIRTATGAAFLWIHHCGKDAARGMRGWSGMRAAIDTEIEVTADDATGGRCAEVTKQRDLGGKGDRYGFKLEAVHLGVNRWNADRTSAVCVSIDAPARPTKGKRPSEIEGAITVFLGQRGAGIKRGELAKALSAPPYQWRTRSIYNAMNLMVSGGLLHESVGIVALAGNPVS